MKAVVIGAGFAGLAAALRLRLAGLEVTVLDKQEAPGGKAHRLERGAYWSHGAHPARGAPYDL